jgi:ankyrin repeat protein
MFLGPLVIWRLVYICIIILTSLASRTSSAVITNEGETPAADDTFFSSARKGDLQSLENYLERDPDLVHTRDAKGNTALIIAAGRGQINAIKLLLKHKANLEDTTQHGLFEGKSALSWAASQGPFRSFCTCPLHTLHHGPHLCMFFYLLTGRADAVALLLQAGANPHRAADVGVFLGKTPLMWASSQGKTDVARLLLSAGVNVDYASQKGNFKVSHTFDAE